MNAQPHTHRTAEEFITIIGPTLGEVMRQYKDRGLAAAGYAITGQAGRHQFAVAGSGETAELFDGTPMVAATFRRAGA